MLIFLYWYMLIGIAFGMFVIYAILKKLGDWQAFCDEFNAIETKFDHDDSFKLTPSVATWLIPLVFITLFAVIWMPFLIYIGSKKQ